MADGAQESLLPHLEDGAATTTFKRFQSKCALKTVLKIIATLVTLTTIACILVYYGAPYKFRLVKSSSAATRPTLTRNCSNVISGASNQQPIGSCCKLNVNVEKGPNDRVLAHSDSTPPLCEKSKPGHEREQRLPQAIIIGARKGGTRALLTFLRLHSAIVASEDEVHFFDKDENYFEGLDSYKDCMPYSNCHQITMEKTPAYFTEKKVPERIHRMNRSIKLLLVLRDPTERAISDYLQIREKKLMRGKPAESFEKLAINAKNGLVRLHYSALQRSIYHIYLSRWLQYFPRNQFMIICSEDLVADPPAELRTVEKFLGLKNEITSDDFYFNETKGFYCLTNMTKRHGTGCLSKSKGRPHPNVDEKVIEKLRDFFRPHNRILNKMIGKDCGWP